MDKTEEALGEFLKQKARDWCGSDQGSRTMKTLLVTLAILFSAPGIASAMTPDRVLSDLTRSGSIVHPQGIWGGR